MKLWLISAVTNKLLVDSNVVFWKSEAEVGEATPFQIFLAAPTTASLSHIPFSSLEVYLSEDQDPIIIKHASLDDAGSRRAIVQTIDLGDVSHDKKTPVELEADLLWEPGNILILHGTIESEVPALLKVCSTLYRE